jgi:hypothetical protein
MDAKIIAMQIKSPRFIFIGEIEATDLYVGPIGIQLH